MPTHDVIEFRVSALENTVARIGAAVESIDDSLKILTSLEVKHAETREALHRCFAEIKDVKEDHEDRIRAVESEMPTVKMVRNWIVTGVVCVVSVAGIMVWDNVTGRTHAASEYQR